MYMCINEGEIIQVDIQATSVVSLQRNIFIYRLCQWLSYSACYAYCFIMNIDPATVNPGVICSDGVVRLVGGSNDLEGRVEVCINNAWGTICSNGFDDNDARVVCTGVNGTGDSIH